MSSYLVDFILNHGHHVINGESMINVSLLLLKNPSNEVGTAKMCINPKTCFNDI